MVSSPDNLFYPWQNLCSDQKDLDFCGFCQLLTIPWNILCCCCIRSRKLIFVYTQLVCSLLIHLFLGIEHYAQTNVKKDIKMEEAEELKAKLEAAGATVSIA